MAVIYSCPKCDTKVTDETYSHECNGVRVVYVLRARQNKQNTVEGYMKWAGSRPNQTGKSD